ncbi:MAG: hypothetical protein U1E29_12350, partial [Coriobacteriia bacterium]|nr:hypothetical protein [Coriobacteriia bacterium]
MSDPVLDPQHQADEQSERERSSARKFVLLAILLLLLALLLYATYYYMNNRRLPSPRIGTGIEAVVAPPEYVFSISGPAGP